jgi:hypothetical protein
MLKGFVCLLGGAFLQIAGAVLDEESHSPQAETALGSSALTDKTDKFKMGLIQNGANELGLVSLVKQVDDTGRVFRNVFISGTFREEPRL